MLDRVILSLEEAGDIDGAQEVRRVTAAYREVRDKLHRTRADRGEAFEAGYRAALAARENSERPDDLISVEQAGAGIAAEIDKELRGTEREPEQ